MGLVTESDHERPTWIGANSEVFALRSQAIIASGVSKTLSHRGMLGAHKQLSSLSVWDLDLSYLKGGPAWTGDIPIPEGLFRNAGTQTHTGPLESESPLG